MASRVLGVIIALAAASGPTRGVSAQDPAPDRRVGAGDVRIDGGRVEPGTWTMRYVRTVNGEERQVGAVRYELTRMTVGDEPAMRAVQSITTPGGQFADTAVFIQKTLRPLYHRSHNQQRVLLLDFHGTRVTGEVIPASGEKSTIDHEMDIEAFDANILDAIYGALPLEVGFKAVLAAYVYESGGPIDVGIEVVGRARIEAEGRTRDAWELAVEYPFGAGRFWVDVENGQPLAAEIGAADGSTTKVVR